MERVLVIEKLDVWFNTIDAVDDFFSPFADKEYALLLVINRTDISELEQEKLSDKIVASGCRYALCFGHRCTTWDDSIDYAFICSDADFNPPDSRFVMTTWHEDEPIDDVIFQFRWNTTFDDFTPSRFLTLFVGENIVLEKETLKLLSRYFSD
jgi:hypothetical protein